MFHQICIGYMCKTVDVDPVLFDLNLKWENKLLIDDQELLYLVVRARETDLILHLGKKKNVVILLSPHEWADNFGNERIFPLFVAIF